ncbi:DUF350 domain-containing protein [Paenibacillus selenitireducens]|uniref:DUF350 domain-containing protein n=1 Tax=Paenibacillus selenitireducens TaxID=1324314 RepID=A0A1T2XL34_9BACL|nr:DUF350 domain-containing protein [Paenibacillus selenitireducens]OPA80436.1 DUF350 domain-containing protein [Paenibacillus selenitireducens]
MIIFNIFISIVVIIILQLLGMVVFSWMTPYNDLEELKKGNAAVGLAMGGRFFGTAILLGVSAYTNASIWHMILWFVVGYVCLIVSYWVFDWVTPGLRLSEHLQKGNLAVGILLCFVFIGMGFAVSSLII